MAQRLDRVLTARGLCPSRARARDAILRGQVLVNGAPARKPGQMVAEDARIEVRDEALAYVSRAALKLLAALRAEPRLRAAVSGAVCADIGASTGGFTQVLLRHGARRVYAVDVGHDQLHPALAADARVVNLQGVNARHLTRAHLPEPPAVIVADVSFISLKKALPAALTLAAPGAWLAALIKPQFEAGPAQVASGGIVRDAKVRRQVAEDIRRWLAQQGWPAQHLLPSPVRGADGNEEWLIIARQAGSGSSQ